MLPAVKVRKSLFVENDQLKIIMPFSKVKMLISNSYLIFIENKKFNIMMKTK